MLERLLDHMDPYMERASHAIDNNPSLEKVCEFLILVTSGWLIIPIYLLGRFLVWRDERREGTITVRS